MLKTFVEDSYKTYSTQHSPKLDCLYKDVKEKSKSYKELVSETKKINQIYRKIYSETHNTRMRIEKELSYRQFDSELTSILKNNNCNAE